MSDNLDQLSDAELSETFAVDMCQTLKRETPRDGGLRAYSVVGTGAWREIREEGAWGWPEDFVDYAMSADAVMPWLEKSAEMVCISRYTGWDELDWAVLLWENDENGALVAQGESPSLARAACLALIRAHRATIAVQSSA